MEKPADNSEKMSAREYLEYLWSLAQFGMITKAPEKVSDWAFGRFADILKIHFEDRSGRISNREASQGFEIIVGSPHRTMFDGLVVMETLKRNDELSADIPTFMMLSYKFDPDSPFGLDPALEAGRAVFRAMIRRYDLHPVYVVQEKYKAGLEAQGLSEEVSRYNKQSMNPLLKEIRQGAARLVMFPEASRTRDGWRKFVGLDMFSKKNPDWRLFGLFGADEVISDDERVVKGLRRRNTIGVIDYPVDQDGLRAGSANALIQEQFANQPEFQNLGEPIIDLE